MSLVQEYFTLQRIHEEKYGEKTVVLMQIGSFFEAYSYDTHGRASEVSSVCNMILTSKNKKESISLHNPHMCGMPTQSIQRYVGVLCKNGFTVVLVEQCDGDPTKRSVANIYSPGTFIDETSDDTSVIASVYRDTMSVAVCWIDISTGKVMFQEVHNPSQSYRDEELTRLIESSGCKEIIEVSRGVCCR